MAQSQYLQDKNFKQFYKFSFQVLVLVVIEACYKSLGISVICMTS